MNKISQSILELLAPGDPKLKDPKQCAYREGREHREYNIRLKKFMEIIRKPPSTESKSLMSSFETIWCFTVGINGEELEKDGFKNYCKEKCNLTKCEYLL